MKNLVGVLPDRAGATVRSALRHPGQITYGLYGTKYKPTFCHGDNLRKYTINQFSWFVSGLPAMGNYLENIHDPDWSPTTMKIDLLIRRGGPPCLPAGRWGRLLSLSKDREPLPTAGRGVIRDFQGF